MYEENKPIWNSLEKTKLVVSALVPILILFFGFWLGLIESNRENQSRVADLRFEVFKDVGKEVNTIYSYLLYVGSWKEMTPVDVLESKRKADTVFYTYSALFSREFKASYNNFMKEAFKTRNGWGMDAKLRTGYENRKNLNTFLSPNDKGELAKIEWDESWNILFTGETEGCDKTRNVKINSEDGLPHGYKTEHGENLSKLYEELNKQIAVELKLN